ncbi:hypothetical protein M2146_002575 [Lachnospiraceae bacterium PF1-22]
MKKIITEKFVAEDGKEFYDEKSCLEYEALLKLAEATKKTIEKTIQLRNQDINGFMPPDGDEWDSDSDHSWFRVNNQEELDFLIDTYELQETSHLKPKEFPTLIHFETSCESDEIRTSTFDECLGYITEFLVLSDLGYSLKKD